MFRAMKGFGFRSPVLATAGVSIEDFFGGHCFAHGRHRHFGGRHKGEELFAPDLSEEQRTPRGDIKFILLELLSDRSTHGYELIKEAENRYGGFRRLSPGSVYPTLQMLEEGGYLTSSQEGDKKVYSITDEGRQFLEERQKSSGFPGEFRTGKPQELIELRKVATELSAAVVTVARSGNVERVNRVRELLDRVRREIYSILAE
ncbi:MAG: hypothetical protein NVS2B14_07980 [Chamaesiphon sp.]